MNRRFRMYARLPVILVFLVALAGSEAAAQTPDTLDACGYFPMAVGNTWEYRHVLVRPRTTDRPQDESETRLERYRIADSLGRADTTFFALAWEERTEAGALIRRDTTLIRYDEASASVVGENLPTLIAWLRCLDAPFGGADSSGDCWPFVAQETKDVPGLFGAPVPVKGFGGFVWGFFVVHGVGLVSGGGGCEPCGPFSDTDHWTLAYARVGEREYGAVIVATERFDAPDERRLAVYPNPVCGSATVETPRAGVLEVFDLLGRRLLVREVRTPGPFTLDLASFAPGVYLLRFGREARVLVVQ